jgi:hypothetical protein
MMLNFFKDRPHSLIEIRQSLDDVTDKLPHFLTLLERHHDHLEESIPVLTDRMAPIDEKQRHLTRFLHLLNMHAKAEEVTLYAALLSAHEREAHLEGLSGQDEHALAFQIAAEIENLNYEFDWSEEADSKAKVLASLVENHLLDAERSLFATARRTISVQDLNRLKMAYVEKCKDYLDHELSEARRALSDHMIQRSL